jgi:hypothetical protein
MCRLSTLVWSRRNTSFIHANPIPFQLRLVRTILSLHFPLLELHPAQAGRYPTPLSADQATAAGASAGLWLWLNIFFSILVSNSLSSGTMAVNRRAIVVIVSIIAFINLAARCTAAA